MLAGTAVAVVMAAGAAGAADLSRPVYKAAPPPIPVFSWTGFYVGVHVGGAWGTKEWSDPSVFFFFGKGGVPTTTFFPDTTINNYGVNGFWVVARSVTTSRADRGCGASRPRPAGPAFAAATLVPSLTG